MSIENLWYIQVWMSQNKTQRKRIKVYTFFFYFYILMSLYHCFNVDQRISNERTWQPFASKNLRQKCIVWSIFNTRVLYCNYLFTLSITRTWTGITIKMNGLYVVRNLSHCTSTRTGTWTRAWKNGMHTHFLDPEAVSVSVFYWWFSGCRCPVLLPI